jgi:hypothetical protein
MSARVRIHLCTYRRAHLLSRALASLQAQTFTDWVCELHNDAPDDSAPAHLVNAVNDPRIQCVTHPRNLGATATFNLLYAGRYSEDYLSLLEDDNWWESRFLERMVAALDAQPDVALAWANMRCWHEQIDGSWRDTGRTIWGRREGAPQPFPWGQPVQVLDALHSNGAMLVRNRDAARHVIPPETPFDIVEPVRERTFRHPVLFVPEVLANFAFTLTTARGSGAAHWIDCQVLLVGSLLAAGVNDEQMLRPAWRALRASPQGGGHVLLAACLLTKRWRALRFAGGRDAWQLLRSALAHPRLTLRMFSVRRRHLATWDFLVRATRAQIAATSGVAPSSAQLIADKQQPPAP